MAELNEPGWVALDDFGNVYVADTGNNRVRMIAASTGTYYGISMKAGDIYTVAGTGTAGYSGDAGPSGLAELNGPNGVAVTSGGTLLITDSSNFRVRAVSGGLPAAKVPAAPSGLEATAGDGQVVLQWNPSTGAASYSAFIASAPGAEQTSRRPGVHDHRSVHHVHGDGPDQRADLLLRGDGHQRHRLVGAVERGEGHTRLFAVRRRRPPTRFSLASAATRGRPGLDRQRLRCLSSRRSPADAAPRSPPCSGRFV